MQRLSHILGTGIDRVNRLNTVSVGLAFGAGGSAGTVLVWFGMLYAIVRTIQIRTPIARPRPILFLTVAALLYWLSGALMAISNPDDPSNRWMLLERAFAPGILVLYARLVVSPPRATLVSLHVAGAVGAIACAFWAILEVLILEEARAAGAAGNSGPFSTVAAVFFAFSLAGFGDRGGRVPPALRALFALGVLAGAYSVIASGMRTLLPALLLVPAILLVLQPSLWRYINARSVLVALFAAAALALVTADTLVVRIGTLAAEISADGFAPNPATSLGQRMAIWQCGLEAVPDLWLTGDGRADAQTLMGDCTQASTGKRLQFSHYHNAPLTALLYGGLLELVAVLGLLLSPLLVLADVRKAHSDTMRAGIALTCCLVTIYALNGATNLMLGHDLLDALYVYFIAATLSVARNDEREHPSP